ncbi:MAG: gamma-glutamylcyclotransferase family protein [Acidimicrobiia bacterium]
MLPLFVYGTLRPGERAWRWYLGRLAVRHRPGLLDGYGLYGRTRPFPFAAPAPGLAVVGELVWVEPGAGEPVLRRLDEYEGAVGPDPLYLREQAEIITDEGPRNAWVWVAGTRLRPDPGELIVSGDWLGR